MTNPHTGESAGFELQCPAKRDSNSNSNPCGFVADVVFNLCLLCCWLETLKQLVD